MTTLENLKCEYDKQFYFMGGIKHLVWMKKQSDNFILHIKNGADINAMNGSHEKLKAKIMNQMPRGKCAERMILLHGLQDTEPF